MAQALHQEQQERQVSSTSERMADAQQGIAPLARISTKNTVVGVYVLAAGISYAQLCEDLTTLASQWRALGTMLNVSVDILDRIEGEKDLAQNCLQKIIQEWLWYTAGPHTKTHLVGVLEKKAIRLNALARTIKDNAGLLAPSIYTHITHSIR